MVIAAMLLDSALVVAGTQNAVPVFTHATALNALSFSPQHGSLAIGQEDSGNASTRAEIVAYIGANPGVYLRELCEDLDLSMGVVQYHVWALVRNGEVEDYRNGRYRRFFAAATYPEMEKKVISVLRQETAGKIVILLSEEGQLSHVRLAASLGVTSQALTWQLGRLRALGMIEASTTGNRAGMSCRLVDYVAELVSKYLQRGIDPFAPPKPECSAEKNSQDSTGSKEVNCFDHFVPVHSASQDRVVSSWDSTAATQHSSRRRRGVGNLGD